jgi:phospholipid/cholesterol/gamma-HCH transport system ATP-binding protein
MQMTDDKPPEPLAIEFRNVSLSFDDKRALDDISLQLKRGEMICITGVSGSGKSVLLRIASGLLVPDEGEVFVEGREIGNLDEQDLLALRSASMGIVFQEQSLFTGMSVYDNTSYRLDEHGWPDEDTERAVREILTFVGLEGEMDKFPEELSVGMGRRLEFARALVGWPKIMLFDEATSGLDPINARMMLDLVIRARDIHQISSLFVTKELHEIPYLAGHLAVKLASEEISIEHVERDGGTSGNKLKVMVLEDGRIAFFGSPVEFESSDLPVVTRLLHPPPSAGSTDAYIPDPWSRSKKPADE